MKVDNFLIFSQSGLFSCFTRFDNKKITYIICAMVVISTAGGTMKILHVKETMDV